MVTFYHNNPFNDYLEEFEKVHSEEIGVRGGMATIYEDKTSEKNRNFSIMKHKFRLGFNMNIKSEKNLKLEEMLDLEKLNKFILTGEK